MKWNKILWQAAGTLRLFLCILFAVLCLCLVLISCVVYSAHKTILDEQIYKTFLDAPPVQKKVDSIIVQSSGLWQVRDYDASVFATVFQLMKAELINPFMSELPAQVVCYLSAETNIFDPVLNLSETRGKVKWILDQAIQQKIPFFLVETIQKAIDRTFARRVPQSMRLFPLIGVTPKMEEEMHAYVAHFHHYSQYRTHLYLSPLIPLVLWFVCMRKRKYFPDTLAAVLGGFALCLALPLTLFNRQLLEIAYTAVNLRGRSGEELSAFIQAALPPFLEPLTEALCTLALICLAALLCVLCYRWLRYMYTKHRAVKGTAAEAPAGASGAPQSTSPAASEPAESVQHTVPARRKKRT